MVTLRELGETLLIVLFMQALSNFVYNVVIAIANRSRRLSQTHLMIGESATWSGLTRLWLSNTWGMYFLRKMGVKEKFKVYEDDRIVPFSVRVTTLVGLTLLAVLLVAADVTTVALQRPVTSRIRMKPGQYKMTVLSSKVRKDKAKPEKKLQGFCVVNENRVITGDSLTEYRHELCAISLSERVENFLLPRDPNVISRVSEGQLQFTFRDGTTTIFHTNITSQISAAAGVLREPAPLVGPNQQIDLEFVNSFYESLGSLLGVSGVKTEQISSSQFETRFNVNISKLALIKRGTEKIFQVTEEVDAQSGLREKYEESYVTIKGGKQLSTIAWILLVIGTGILGTAGAFFASKEISNAELVALVSGPKQEMSESASECYANPLIRRVQRSRPVLMERTEGHDIVVGNV